MKAMLPYVLAGIFGIALTLYARSRHQPTMTTSPPPSTPSGSHYSVESWIPYLAPLIATTDIPLLFCTNWIRIESGGNPCAYGSATAFGPDGTPREQGIAQLWNPDDFEKLKVPSGSFRAYCVPGTQTCSRPLTSAEMDAQARSLIGLIQSCQAYATRVLVASGAKGLPGWQGQNYWRLVKLVHATPGLVKGMSYVTEKLGRAPADWDEHKNGVLGGIKLDQGTERGRDGFARLFANAERTASGVTWSCLRFTGSSLAPSKSTESASKS